jgi:hypothetical protein
MVTQTEQEYEYAGGNPVSTVDPSGAYDYTYVWYLGQTAKLGDMFHIFTYFSHHVASVFPFSTGGCQTFYLKESCVFLPGAGIDHLHVSAIDADSVTLTVDNWCQTPGRGSTDVCISGDPPGSTITFMTGEWFDSVLPGYSSNSSQFFDFLAQIGHAPNAGPITNLIAPIGAFFTWHQQALNLAKGLGGNPNDVFFIEGPGWSTSPF